MTIIVVYIVVLCNMCEGKFAFRFIEEFKVREVFVFTLQSLEGFIMYVKQL